MQPETPSRIAPSMSPASPTLSTQRSARVRTAWVLASVALVFFGAIIVAQRVESPLIAIGALGFALIGFVWAAMTGRDQA
jgi:hypothetical protein